MSLASADGLALQIAETVFPHNLDRHRREQLARLLAAFANEVRRSAIEP